MGYCFLYKKGGSIWGRIPETVKTSIGKVITLNDSKEKPLRGLRIFGKTTQNGTPTPDSPVALVSAGNAGNITVTISGDEVEPQNLTLSTPNGLPGIPVSSGGNYTDESLQQWVCDEVDFGRGVYVQRVAVKTFDGSSDERWDDTASANAPYGVAPTNIANCTDTDTQIICNRYPTATIQESWRAKDYLVSRPGASASNICFRNVDITSLDAWIADVSANPITIQYVLAAPIETALSAEELVAYSALHTKYPNTTILNDGGAGMEVKYVSVGG